MEEFLKNNRHWLVAVCTLGVLLLCYSELVRGELANPMDELEREGFGDVALLQVRTDTGAYGKYPTKL